MGGADFVMEIAKVRVTALHAEAVTSAEVDTVRSRYLGQVTWSQLAKTLGVEGPPQTRFDT